MTTVLSRPRPLVLAALALAATLTTFSVTTRAEAAPRGGAYAVTLAAPLAAPRAEILGGTLWHCAGDQCRAPADGGRAVIACQRVAKKFGAVAQFAAPEGALAAEDLTRCNAR